MESAVIMVRPIQGPLRAGLLVTGSEASVEAGVRNTLSNQTLLRNTSFCYQRLPRRADVDHLIRRPAAGRTQPASPVGTHSRQRCDPVIRSARSASAGAVLGAMTSYRMRADRRTSAGGGVSGMVLGGARVVRDVIHAPIRAHWAGLRLSGARPT